MDPNQTYQADAILKQLREYEAQEQLQKSKHRPISEVLGIQRNADNMDVTIRVFRDTFNNEALFTQALQAAVQETIQRIASVIINERRQEIEDACNFGELRDVLAAELARQFMASRLTGQTTPFDNAKMPTPGYSSSMGAGASLLRKAVKP